MKIPPLPPPPAAPCEPATFTTWAQQVIDLLQPLSAKEEVASCQSHVTLSICHIGKRVLGQWRQCGHKLKILLDEKLVAESCRLSTAPLVDTLLHECAHMLAPHGEHHGKRWRAIARALGCTPRATAEIIEYDNPSTTHQENTHAMPLSPAQITGAEPLPSEPAGTTATHVPSFDAKAPYHKLAEWVAHSIPYGALFRQDNKFVTIEIEPSGNIKLIEMTKLRLPTWLPEQQICTFHGARRKDADPDEPPPVTSISPAQAELIMASDVFRTTMPELAGVSNVRLPIITSTQKNNVNVHRPDGSIITCMKEVFKFEPSGEGYDKNSKIFTHSTIVQDFARTISLTSARNFLVRAFSESALDGGFLPPADKAGEALNPLLSRSLGATVAAMLGQFLHHNIDSFPMILVVANQPGTGKSFHVRSILAPIFGEIEASNYLEDDKEFRQTLNAALFDGSRYFFLDDVKVLNSPALNRFITAPRIKDRILHTQISFVKDMRMQFFTTGNRLQTTPDIARRSLPIDLFWSQDATQRNFQGIISEEIILRKETRKGFLRALWSMVHHWQEAGCPRYVEHAPGGAFKRFTELAVNIAMHAGFANPYGPRMVDLDSGDSAGAALQEVLITLADSIAPSLESDSHRGLSAYFRVAEIEQWAERMHKIDIIVPRGNNKRDNLGIAMRSMKGRELVDSRGRRFTVGNKRDKASSRYLFTIISEPTRDGLAPAAYAALQLALGNTDAAELPDPGIDPYDDNPF